MTNQNGFELLGYNFRKIFEQGEIEQLKVVTISESLSRATSYIRIGVNLNASNSGKVASLYNVTDPKYNMANGKISPYFSRNLSVYDEFGIHHTIIIGFLKTGTNIWQTEIYSPYP